MRGKGGNGKRSHLQFESGSFAFAALLLSQQRVCRSLLTPLTRKLPLQTAQDFSDAVPKGLALSTCGEGLQLMD